MGNLSDSVRILVDEITATTHNRHTHLQELAEDLREARQEWRSELQEVSQALRDHFAATRAQRTTATRARREATRQFMDESHRAHQERAQALGDSYASNRDQRATATRARREAACQLMDEISMAHEQRRVTVSELRSEAHNLVERFSLEHQDMAEALREKLSSEGNALKGVVREMVGELVADRRQAHQNWTEGLKKKLAPEAVAAKAVAAQPEGEAVRPLPLEERVLEVIARHAEGIRLVDIGNDLGVDWRSLLGIARTIVEEDTVERIDTLYYPKSRGLSEAGEEA